jgi:L-glyceraldehyde 3-phosphate reductase
MVQEGFAEHRHQNMPYRRCGRSGLMLPAVSLGFWWVLGEPGNEQLCRECMYYAFDHGVTHFDLANNYGPPRGSAELVVGKILRDMPRDELVISTKAGWDMWKGPYGDWGSRKHLIASLDQSLKRLGVDYVDIFYHHRPDPETPIEETMGALDQIVRQGKALYVGVSQYRGPRFEEAIEAVHRHDWAPITVHQPSYNMLDRWIEPELLPLAASAGAGVVVFSPLAQGVLTDRYLGGLTEDSRMGKRGKRGERWYEKHKQAGTWEKVAALNELSKQRGQTLAEMALTWCLRDARITSVLAGASKVEQIAANIRAAQGPPLSEEELGKIEAILS